jgi:flagellar basal-body rod protein FlgB
MKLFNATKVPVLSNAMDVYALRGRVSAENIANINTPGYAAQRVTFEEEMAKAIQNGTSRPTGMVTHDRHIPIGLAQPVAVQPAIVETPADASLSDDALASGMNNVDIDNEMAEIAKNQLRFRFAARMISGQFKGLQKSIRGQI